MHGHFRHTPTLCYCGSFRCVLLLNQFIWHQCTSWRISWQGLVVFSTGPTSAADWRYRVCRQEVRQQVIIKAAKRIFNSDKICGSYCDFYFGVTFFGTHCNCVLSSLSSSLSYVRKFMLLCKQLTQPGQLAARSMSLATDNGCKHWLELASSWHGSHPRLNGSSPKDLDVCVIFLFFDFFCVTLLCTVIYVRVCK